MDIFVDILQPIRDFIHFLTRRQVDSHEHLCYTGGVVEVRDGQDASYTVTGRVAVMILYLAQQAQRLNELPKLRVEFFCAGFKVVKPKIEILEEELPVE